MKDRGQLNWISVEDDLPDSDQDVFFLFDTRGSSWYRYPINMRRGDFRRISPTESTFRHDCRRVNNALVTHWAPIPPPPNETRTYTE